MMKYVDMYRDGGTAVYEYNGTKYYKDGRGGTKGKWFYKYPPTSPVSSAMNIVLDEELEKLENPDVMDMEDFLEKIKEVSSATTTSPGDVIHKLQEELGEVSAEWMRIISIKPLKEGEDPQQRIKEEGCDLLLSLLDLLHCRFNMSLEEILLTMQPGLLKWASQKHK